MIFSGGLSILLDVKVFAMPEPGTDSGRANLMNKCHVICKHHWLKIHHNFFALKVLAQKPSTFICTPQT